MTEQSRASQSAEIAARADERAQAAQRDIGRVERSLTERLDHLGEVVTDGFEKIFQKLDHMADEIVALKVENAKRTGVERFLKWALTIAVTIALGIAGIFATWHNDPPSHH